VSRSVSLNNYKWYAGELDRNGAGNLLKGKPSGSFLVRKKQQDVYAVSLVYANDVKHIMVRKSKDGLYHLAECKNFMSVPELISYYEENTMSRSFMGLETTLKYPFKQFRNHVTPQPANQVASNHFTSSNQRTSLPSSSRSSLDRVMTSQFNRTSSSSGSLTSQSTSRASNVSSSNSSIASPPLGKVLYKFESRSSSELQVSAGDVVKIINKKGESHGWWKVEMNGKLGYVPASYVVEIED